MLRSWFGRAAVMLALVVLASACSSNNSSIAESPTSGGTGGSQTTSSALGAEDYVKSACTAMADWLAAIQARAGDLSNLSSGDTEAAKTAVLDFLDGVIADTDTMLSSVDGLGAPDVTDGAAAHEALVGVLSEARDLFQGARDDVDGLSTADTQAFGEALTQIGDDLSSSANSVGSAFADFHNADLDTAFQAEPACAPLQSS